MMVTMENTGPKDSLYIQKFDPRGASSWGGDAALGSVKSVRMVSTPRKTGDPVKAPYIIGIPRSAFGFSRPQK
jgi:hypothetical protein